MNHSNPNLWLLALALSTIGAVSAHAGNVSTNSAPQIRSIFVMLNSNKDGRDPFFPDSTRLIEVAAPTNHVAEITSLKVPGISGPPEHMLAMINNHTFAVGEEGDVLTTTGRIHLRCVEIHADAVIVEVNGQLHRINLEKE